MSKIICEICGTAYPDTAKECPICGFPHSQTEEDLDLDLDALQSQENHQTASAAPKKVKGGRFSSKNVRKRHADAHEETYEAPEQTNLKPEEPTDYDNTGKPQKELKIAIAVLAALVILVGAYIAYRFVSGSDAYGNPKEPSLETGMEPSESSMTESQTQPSVAAVACEDLIISNDTVEIRGVGRGWLLDVSVFPENTTDAVTFSSSNEEVAEVSASGRITAVGPGTAIITITCGNISRECVVNCNFDGIEVTEVTEVSETTEAPEETEAATEAAENDEFLLNYNDVSLFNVGETFTFVATSGGSGLSRSQVEWQSTNPEVATVENGTVKAVSGGLTTITAIYDGKVQKCIVRCRIETPATTEQSTDSNWKMSDSDGDATLTIGESFTLKLTNGSGKTADVSWSSSNSGVVSISGNSITGKIPGITNVTATVDGQTFTCIVRVIEGR